MRKLICLAMCGMLLAAGGYVMAMDFDLDLDARADLASRYIWRGRPMNPDPVLQPSIAIGAEGFSLGVWANMDLSTAVGNEFEFTELRYTLDYTAAVDELTVSLGFVYYDYVNSILFFDEDAGALNVGQPSDTYEAYARVEIDMEGLRPSIATYYDMQQTYGFYTVGALTYAIPVSGDIDLELGGALGWGTARVNEYYYGRKASRISDASISAAMPIRVTDSVVVTPNVVWTSILASSFRDAWGPDMPLNALSNDNLTIGISAAYSF